MRNCWLVWTAAGMALPLCVFAAQPALPGQERGSGTLRTPGADATQVGPRTERVDLAGYAQVRYAAHESRARADGSKVLPWPGLEQALAAITDAGPARRYAILVASGTYRTRALRLKPHVDLFGGFDPGAWLREIHQNATILDAEGKDRVLLGADHARVDGFTLRGGRARGHGGAVLCERASPILTNNRFTDNATLVAPDYVRGILHQIGSEGGAIACTQYASPRIERNLFLGNWTEMGGGGAIGVRSDSIRPREEVQGPAIRNNAFIGQRTGLADTAPDVKQRARSSNGGAISLSNALGEITGNLFVDNRAGGNGDGGAIYCEYEASPLVAQNHFIGNRAEDDGGALYSMKLSEPRIEANVFAGNAGGGSLRLSKQGRARITGNLLFANPGGGINSGDSWGLLEANVIMDNDGPGVSHSLQVATYLRPAVLRGNVVRGNRGGQLQVGSPAAADVEGNNVEGGHPGSGNLDTDPRRDTRRHSAAVTMVAYDSNTGRTRLTVEALPAAASLLPGRVARVGDRWGLVHSVTGRDLSVWGDLRAPAPAVLEVLGSYLPLAGER